MKRKLGRDGIILPEIVISLGLAAACMVLFYGWIGDVILHQRSIMNSVSLDLERSAGISWFVAQLKQCSQDPETWIMQGPDKIVFKKNGAVISFEVNKGRLMRYQWVLAKPWRREKLVERRGAGGTKKTAAVILKNVDTMVCTFWPERTSQNRLRDTDVQKTKRVTGIAVEFHMQDGTCVSIDAAFRAGERIW